MDLQYISATNGNLKNFVSEKDTRISGRAIVKTRSIRFNFIMNFILTASSILFPLITAPYILRVLQAEGNGRVDFASSVMTCFMMFASLGIPTYGIRN